MQDRESEHLTAQSKLNRALHKIAIAPNTMPFTGNNLNFLFLIIIIIITRQIVHTTNRGMCEHDGFRSIMDIIFK